MNCIIRETLGLKHHRIAGIRYSVNEISIELENIRRRNLPCGHCGRRAKVRDRLRRRSWRHVPLWGIPVLLYYRPCRVKCPECGIRVEDIPWAEGKSPLTQPLVVVLATWARLLAWDVVGRLYGVSWSTVRAAVEGAVKYGLSKRDMDEVFYIGIDEISRRRGHIYHTQVYDLRGKRLLWSAEGRKAETLRAFFEELGPERCKQIKAVCCDMWAPYIDVVKEVLPDAVLVFDKFHLIKHLLKAVNDVRKAEAARLKKEGSDVLVGTMHLWLKNVENLTGKQSVKLSAIEKLNLKVNRSHMLKELFRKLWTYKRKGWAQRFLRKWFWWATHSRIKEMRKFAWLVRKHEEGILGWFDAPINNGAVEAMNNNAKSISHRARGYRTEKTFTLAMLHCMGKLELPQTVHKFS